MSDSKTPLRVSRRPGFVWLARRYVRSRMRRAFDGVYTRGLSPVRDLATRSPVLVAATHVAWWDPLFAVLLDEELGTTGFALMDEQNLARLPFFGWLGAVPLLRDDPRAALAQLRASTRLLDAPRRALWIFPQGEQRPAHLRPLGLKSGLVRLAVEARAPIVPLALNYLYRKTSEPTAFAAFGEPIEPERFGRRGLLEAVEASLVGELAAIDRFATEGHGDFTPVLAPRETGDTPAAARLLLAPRRRREPRDLRAEGERT